MISAPTGRSRTDADGCRRYMPLRYTFDTRNAMIDHEENFGATWEPEIRAQWRHNLRQITVGLVAEFGIADFDTKFEDYRAVGIAPMSVVALHNVFLAQIRSAFVAHAYYPALVGASALGERILNQLVIVLRGDYLDHPATTPEIASWKSFAKWSQCTDALAGWGVLSPDEVDDFTRLGKLRHRAVHYNAGLDNTDAREIALDAVHLLQDIIGKLFAPFGGPPRFIEGTTGQTFITLDAESQPLVRRFYLPACVLVSPRYQMRPKRDEDGRPWFDVYDDGDYQVRYPTLTDAEYAEHCKDITRFWPEPISDGTEETTT
ncbi:hypothetical protein [Mycolicibacterium fortuitum]|uniref:hypothetical protein n=1 Tax=Mycolicibacterium fortuitum TaxID=1766 RepID=UPI001CE068AD|nr:hypothetical protein [Mycolicibacterium fortuitum]MCA4726891.1 hypothetical protein [Mycolicibacterium fortuitum]